jgi:hypothetical protein
MGDTWALVVTELRRHPQLCYKSDIIAISGKLGSFSVGVLAAYPQACPLKMTSHQISKVAVL